MLSFSLFLSPGRWRKQHDPGYESQHVRSIKTMAKACVTHHVKHTHMHTLPWVGLRKEHSLIIAALQQFKGRVGTLCCYYGSNWLPTWIITRATVTMYHTNTMTNRQASHTHTHTHTHSDTAF